jgi:hypothetical protein
VTDPGGSRGGRIDLGHRPPLSAYPPPGDGYADKWQIGSYPPKLRRSWTRILQQPSPAAGASFTHVVPSDAWERILSATLTLTTSAAAGNRLVTAQFASGDGVAFDQEPAGAWCGPSQAQVVFFDQRVSSNPGPDPSLEAEGSVTGPGAGAAIATTGALAAGEYTVQGVISLGGTTAAADGNNFELKVGATVVTVLEIPSASGSQASFGPIVVAVPAATAVTVNAVAAGTGTAVYTAQFNATSGIGSTVYGQLPDLTLHVGWQFGLVVTGIQAGDQLSGITLMLERFASDYASGTLADDELDRWRELALRQADRR